MKKLGKFKLFGLLIFLSVVLVFVGINFLEAKRTPKVQWKVAIPALEEAEEYGYNLYGARFNGAGEFVNDDADVNVMGEKKRSRKDVYYEFRLWLINTNERVTSYCPEEPETVERPIEYNYPGLYTVGFQGIFLNPIVEHPDEGATCLFPPMTDIPHPSCSVLGEPFCMQCFLNEWEHPSSWACMWCENHDRSENRGYRAAYVQIRIFDDIEEYPILEEIPAEIGLYSSVYTGYAFEKVQDFWHEIEIHRPVEPVEVIYVADVTRLDEDSWEIIFTEETEVVFEETYKELVGEVKPKGRSGGIHTGSVELTTMIATADHFKFKTTWTRSKIEK